MLSSLPLKSRVSLASILVLVFFFLLSLLVPYHSRPHHPAPTILPLADKSITVKKYFACSLLIILKRIATICCTIYSHISILRNTYELSHEINIFIIFCIFVDRTFGYLHQEREQEMKDDNHKLLIRKKLLSLGSIGKNIYHYSDNPFMNS